MSAVRLVAAMALAALFAGCAPSEAPQKSGRYQGKEDTVPWSNVPPESAKDAWKAGDKVSWESAIRNRNLAQNEYERAK